MSGPEVLGQPDHEHRLTRMAGAPASPLAVLIGCLTVGASLRILTVVVSGSLDLADRSLPFRGTPRAYDVLTTYGAAGDAIGALLVLALAALLTSRSAGGVSRGWFAAARVIVWLTGIGTLLYVAGVIVGATAVFGLPGRSTVEGIGLALAYLVLIGGAGVALARPEVI